MKGKIINIGGENGRYIYLFKDDKIIVYYEEFDVELNRLIRFKVIFFFDVDMVFIILDIFEE